MSLTTLKFTSETRISNDAGSPLERTRATVLKNIQIQRELLAHERNGTSADITKVVKAKDGSEASKKLRPRRWFFKSATSNDWLLNILVGHKPIALREGMTSIAAGNLDGVDSALNIIAQAIQAGEMDGILTAASAARAARPKVAKPPVKAKAVVQPPTLEAKPK